MLSLKQFLTGLYREDATDTADGVRTTIFGLSVAVVMLPSEVLTEDRVGRMTRSGTFARRSSSRSRCEASDEP